MIVLATNIAITLTIIVILSIIIAIIWILKREISDSFDISAPERRRIKMAERMYAIKQFNKKSSGLIGCIIPLIAIVVIVFLFAVFDGNFELLMFLVALVIASWVGYIAKSYMDKMDYGSKNKKQHSFSTESNTPYLHLAAFILQADNEISKDESRFVETQFQKMFGLFKGNAHVFLLQTIIGKKINITLACSTLIQQLEHKKDRKIIFHGLFALAACDGGYDTNEEKKLRQIAHNLQLNDEDFAQIAAGFNRKAVFNFTNQEEEKSKKEQQQYANNQYTSALERRIANAYTILGLSSNASDDELRTAYRNLAKEHHPDRVSYLGDLYARQAHERFQTISAAYELIKEQRNIK